MHEPVRVAVLGCGTISDIYLKNITERFCSLRVTGVCDLDPLAAQKKQAEYGLPKAYATYEEMLADDAVEIVLNLSPPAGHYPLSKQALLAGKHVYCEKPLATSFAQAAELMELAGEKGLCIGCAPDVPLSAAQQTCRKLIDDGVIGRPIGFSANLVKVPPVESWHMNPDFYYRPGGGPLWDMGPYYLSALVHFLGPIAEVSGMSGRHFDTRTITSKKRYGEVIPVETDTTILAMLQMESGAAGFYTATFDWGRGTLPFLEIYGTKGSISVPNPNDFSGEIRLLRAESGVWEDVPEAYAYAENSRGLGLADMAAALRNGRAHRAGGEIALHVVEAIQKIEDSAKHKTHMRLQTSCKRPDAMRPDGSL